jgi:ATP-binding cassette subfamily B protein
MKPSLFGLLKDYRLSIFSLVVLTIIGNALNLAVPKIMSHSIDSFNGGNFVLNTVIIEFLLVSVGIFIFTYFQSVIQTYASERVARDLRTKLIAKISLQDYSYIQSVNPSKLLTNLTSDVDAVKAFV